MKEMLQSSRSKIKLEDIQRLLDEAEKQEVVLWEKELIVSYKLKSGFTILGRAACVNPANFDIEIGRQLAREDAENQLWQLEGYVLQLELAGLVQRQNTL